MSWFRRMFRWDKTPSSIPPPDEEEGEVTGIYNTTLQDLQKTTNALSQRAPSPSLADAERRVQDAIQEAHRVFDAVLKKRPP